MGENICLLCKNIINAVTYNIDKHYTKCSNLLMRTLLERVFENKVVLKSDLNVCVVCVDLLNELDFAETTYIKIRQKVLNYFGYPNNDNTYCNNTLTSNAYSQTDVFLENLIEFDIQGKNKIINEESKVCEVATVELNNSKTEYSSKNYECHLCAKKFVSKSKVSLHMKRQHNSIDIDCKLENNGNDSDKTTTINVEEITIKSEVVEEINNTGGRSEDNCEENTSDTSDNQVDVQKPRKGNQGRKKKNPGVLKPYKCNSCPKTWKTLGELKSHLSAHSDARPFICEVCGQAYKHKSALDVHVGMHNGIYPFICTYCNKSFTQKGALQRHLPIHTGETPYQCDLCGKRFVHHTSFSIHQLSHSGQKDYKCAQCGLALLSGSHLKRHMRVHTGERNYVCPFCGKRFAERYNLASHQKLHENSGSSTVFKRNYRCQICGNTFSRRLILDEHMAKDHQKVTDADVPFIQQLFTKSEVESVWASNYNSGKTNMPESSY